MPRCKQATQPRIKTPATANYTAIGTWGTGGEDPHRIRNHYRTHIPLRQARACISLQVTFHPEAGLMMDPKVRPNCPYKRTGKMVPYFPQSKSSMHRQPLYTSCQILSNTASSIYHGIMRGRCDICIQAQEHNRAYGTARVPAPTLCLHYVLQHPLHSAVCEVLAYRKSTVISAIETD